MLECISICSFIQPSQFGQKAAGVESLTSDPPVSDSNPPEGGEKEMYWFWLCQIGSISLCARNILTSLSQPPQEFILMLWSLTCHLTFGQRQINGDPRIMAILSWRGRRGKTMGQWMDGVPARSFWRFPSLFQVCSARATKSHTTSGRR
jgi:hypothetical protein